MIMKRKFRNPFIISDEAGQKQDIGESFDRPSDKKSELVSQSIRHESEEREQERSEPVLHRPVTASPLSTQPVPQARDFDSRVSAIENSLGIEHKYDEKIRQKKRNLK